MKEVVCKNCGAKTHWTYQCWKNPRKRKYAIKRKYSGYKQGVKPKKDKLLRDEKSLNRRRLILELDKYCSWIVRLKASDKYGVITCYTCGKRIPYKMAHCCHYISRRYGGTRFDFDNLRAGCEYCLTGEAELYREDFSVIKQKDVKKGDMILARNPMSKGMMIVEVESIFPLEVDKTKVLDCDGDIVEGNFGHLIETRWGFAPIEKIDINNIIKIWKK